MIGVTAAATVAVWPASLLVWIAILYADVSTGWCSDWTTEAECNARQHDAAVTSIFVGLLLTAIAVGLLFLLIRAVARPRVRREWWYLVGAVAIAPMPSAAVLIGLLSHPRHFAVGFATAATILIAWTTVWALGLHWLTGRELRRQPPAADALPSS
jgi:ABC-type Fe3+ transport system permease subunit